MPYLGGYEGVYAEYDFDEPWDGPNNIQLLPLMPRDYGCPQSRNEDSIWTDIVAVVGDGSVFDAISESGLDAVESPARSIIVVEMANSAIPWTKPQDLDLGTMTFVINDGSGNGIFSHHSGDALVLLADNTVYALSDGTSAEKVRQMVTNRPAAEVETAQ